MRATLKIGGVPSSVLLIILSSLLCALFASLFCRFYENPPVPKLPEIWWSNETADTAIRPFKIIFSDEDINDLKRRLRNTREFPAALNGSGWTYGVDGGHFLPTIIRHWLHEYDFKEGESRLNRYPQFITNIQGLEIHYVRAKPNERVAMKKRVLPLLLQHGWPGSILEFHKILPMLIEPRDEHDFVFHVVAPSLPGFGFSTSATKSGLSSPHTAIVMKNLMLRLGFHQFYTQGGDLGAVTTAHLAALFPQHVLGMHSNMCVSMSAKNVLKTFLYSLVPSPLFLSAEDRDSMYPLGERLIRMIQETGYLHIQATKPDTVGIGPSDSPAGLAAYVLEKFSTGTNPSYRFRRDGGLLDKFTADELVDNLMMYWMPNSMTTAMRIYAETFNLRTRSLGIDSVPIIVPTACAQFPNEIHYQPEEFLSERFKNLISVKKMPRGGHFAAMEEPELLADDIWRSIETMERLRIETKK